MFWETMTTIIFTSHLKIKLNQIQITNSRFNLRNLSSSIQTSKLEPFSVTFTPCYFVFEPH